MNLNQGNQTKSDQCETYSADGGNQEAKFPLPFACILQNYANSMPS